MVVIVVLVGIIVVMLWLEVGVIVLEELVEVEIDEGVLLEGLVVLLLLMILMYCYELLLLLYL